LKLSIKNCGQTAADGDFVTIDSLPAPYPMVQLPSAYDLLFSYKLTILHMHDWHTIVRYIMTF